MIDSTSYGDAYSESFSCTYPITLFAWNNGADGIVKNKSQIYGCKLYSGSTLIRDFTPCKNPSGEVGLYDYVTKTFYGNVGGGSLPDGYTELEYLQSTGTQYIDTGFKPSNYTRVVADFMVDAWGSGTTFLFGAQTSNNQRYCLGFSSSGTMRNDYGTQYTSIDIISAGTRYTADKNKNVFTYSGSTQTWTQTAETFSNTLTMHLFARDYGSSPGYLKGKIYNLKIYNNTVLIRNFVPAKLNSDGSLGLFDTVSKEFYTNAGTGTFVAGAEINHNFIAGAEV